MRRSSHRTTCARRSWWLVAAFLCGKPVAAQILPETAAEPRVLAQHASWVTGFAIGPAFPVGPARGPLENGFDFASTVEYTFDQPSRLWLRAVLDVNQFPTTEALTGPGYGYELKINNSATSLLLDVGYRQPFGRVTPFLFIGAGGAYLSSSQISGQQNGQVQRAGQESGFTASVHGGLGLEYQMIKSKAVPYAELAALALPERRVAGKRVAFVTPLLGIKFPF